MQATETVEESGPRLPDCPLEYAGALLGGKWKIRLLWAIHTAGSIRFNRLKRELDGISDLMLSNILKELAANGIVRREQFDETPPHVEYSLTENGRRFIDSLAELRRWARSHANPSPKSRRR